MPLKKREAWRREDSVYLYDLVYLHLMWYNGTTAPLENRQVANVLIIVSLMSSLVREALKTSFS